jgi:SNF2 family DNA or RNA helicase
LVCAGMKQRERTAIIDAFTGAIDKDSGIKKTKQDFQILVGTTRLIGTGLQLTRACNLVMMEPDYEFYRELQAVSRIHRIGQKNPRSYSFRLIDQGSEVEARIVRRQEERGELLGKEVPTQLLEDFLEQKQLEQLAEEERRKKLSLKSTDGSEEGRVPGEWKEIVNQFPVPPSGPSGTTGITSRFIEYL